MTAKTETLLNNIAGSYVKLVLSVGIYNSDYVDAYYGPPELEKEIKKEKPSLECIIEKSQSLLEMLRDIDCKNETELLRLRHQYLEKQIKSLLNFSLSLQGKQLTFDEEAHAYYDTIPPKFTESYFQNILNELDNLLPAKGPIQERFDNYHKNFIIPRENLEKVFNTAINECRARTKKYINMPLNESFNIEYVENKPWSGYNWYKGNYESLIQINTDLPIFIERAVDLAAHEGYPGHHVYNCILESELVRKKGWMEFTAYALFSPQSLIAEGTANYGIDVVLPGKERLEFEEEILFPLAGLDKNLAKKYYNILNVLKKLNYAENEAARKYLDNTITRDETIAWLMQYALMSADRAKQRIKFYDKYRSYVINYNAGKDLVQSYIEKRIEINPSSEKRWEEFIRLISSPTTASNLQQQNFL